MKWDIQMLIGSCIEIIHTKIGGIFFIQTLQNIVRFLSQEEDTPSYVMVMMKMDFSISIWEEAEAEMDTIQHRLSMVILFRKQL